MNERFPNCNIHSTCIIDDDVEIGDHTLIGPFNFIRNGTTIGKNCKIGPMNVFEGSTVNMGNNVRIGTHVNLGFGTVIEDFVFIAGHFTGANDNEIVWCRKGFEPEPYKIKFGARIGLGVVVLPGIVIGKEAFVGAGSLVTKDVNDYEIVYGHPATVHGHVDKNNCIVVKK